MEIPTAIFKKLCKEIKAQFIGAKLDFEEKNQRMAKKDKMKKQFLACWGNFQQCGKEPEQTREKKFIRKRALTSKELSLIHI